MIDTKSNTVYFFKDIQAYAYLDVLKFIEKNDPTVDEIKDYVSKRIGNVVEPSGSTSKTKTTETTSLISKAVIKANKSIVQVIKDSGVTPEQAILDMTSGIQEVGSLYQSGVYFLPQLIASADVMQIGMEYCNSFSKESTEYRGTVVIATVQGDIHDIGKNLVTVMLRNNGYKVYDLGKDVPASEIISKAEEVRADMIGLSALMTTTMKRMRDTVDNTDIPVLIGGACITSDYAEEIGAIYCDNAQDTVDKANLIMEDSTVV